MEENARRRKGIRIMGRLVGLVRPLLPVMLLAVALGVLGYLCAIFLTVLAAYGLLRLLSASGGLELLPGQAGFFLSLPVGTVLAALAVLALLRGLFHCGEQYCNHFIAFKLLARIRHQVFAALRRLCPAKLESRDKGNLISMITTDVELLEVFYAHTISPIAIAVATSAVMVFFLGQISGAAALWALAGYGVVGIAIPLACGRLGGGLGMEYRSRFGELNSFVLESLRGLDETIQYQRGAERRREMAQRSQELAGRQEKLNRLETLQRCATSLAILVFSFGMLFLMLGLRQAGQADAAGMVIATVAMMGSFGPVSALASLSNNLNQTLASGERILSLLEETPQVEEIQGQEPLAFDGAALEQVCFSYGGEEILRDFSLPVSKNRILGIHGPSGCGKSTALKLLMRFWDVQGGRAQISGRDIRRVNTQDLRMMEALVTQDTQLFHDSIANNIGIGKLGASREEIVEAARKASIHEFIQSLPKGYDTEVGELGDTLSGGERQRIGLARAFLHNAPCLLLDEPTSNLDALNEGIILRSLQKEKRNRTVVLVSHRKSTLNLADTLWEMGE